MKLFTAVFANLLFVAPVVVAADDLDISYASLKEAVANKDATLVKKLAGETSALARVAANAPAPQSAEEKEAWKASVAHGKEIDVYTEYALYATALASPPATTVDLLATLEKQNPKSKYLDDAYPSYFLALSKSGAEAQIVPVAEKALANLPENDDLLLVLADHYYGKSPDRALQCAERLTGALGRHAKPEGMAAGDWERKKATAFAHGYWIAGMVYATRNNFMGANKSLRAALPYLQGDEYRLSHALFQLGIANYQLGRATMNRAQILEGAKFSDQVAAMKSPLAQQAWSNAYAMRQEAEKLFGRK